MERKTELPRRNANTDSEAPIAADQIRSLLERLPVAVCCWMDMALPGFRAEVPFVGAMRVPVVEMRDPLESFLDTMYISPG